MPRSNLAKIAITALLITMVVLAVNRRKKESSLTNERHSVRNSTALPFSTSAPSRQEVARTPLNIDELNAAGAPRYATQIPGVTMPFDPRTAGERHDIVRHYVRDKR